MDPAEHKQEIVQVTWALSLRNDIQFFLDFQTQ